MVKVYIFTDFFNLKRLEMLTKLLSQNGYQCEVTKNIDKLNVETDIIISSNVSFQYDIFNQYCSDNIYTMLDNKISFYNYLNKNNDLLKENDLFLITSYDTSYKGENIAKNFIVKNSNGYSAKFNQIIHGNIYDIIKTYSSKNQIQEILDVKNIYGVSLCCKFGKIIGIYTYLSDGAITASSQENGFSCVRNCYIKFPQVRSFLKKMIDKLQYNGIIEVEFLIDLFDKIFVMECNPRISGSLCVSLYFNEIIKKYIKTFHDKTVNEINLSK